jgi:hypothetical protein
MSKQRPVFLLQWIGQSELYVTEASGEIGYIASGVAMEGAYIVWEEQTDSVAVHIFRLFDWHLCGANKECQHSLAFWYIRQ